MEKQMKWGLATLMLLLGIAAVFLFLDKDTETEPEMTLGQPTKDLLKQGVQVQQEVTQEANASDNEPPEQQAVDKPPPPGETKDSGYWEGDRWVTDEEVTQHVLDSIPFLLESARKGRDSTQEAYDRVARMLKEFPDHEHLHETLAKHKERLDMSNREISSLLKFKEKHEKQ